MSLATTRNTFVSQLVAAAEGDPQIVGLVDYGSSSQGRADAWSDVDVALFVRDPDLEPFEASWKQWASQFGTLLLAYIGGVGHPWAVYDAVPIPAPKLGPRKVDVETMYNVERYRPTYNKKIGLPIFLTKA